MQLDCLRMPKVSAFALLLNCNRNCSDRVVVLEASVETYKRKLENLGDLKRQMKLLEENNMTYMQNTVSLEEELRKANAARAQLETYKRQVSDLHTPQNSVWLLQVRVCDSDFFYDFFVYFPSYYDLNEFFCYLGADKGSCGACPFKVM